jgi:hypothetical protein
MHRRDKAPVVELDEVGIVRVVVRVNEQRGVRPALQVHIPHPAEVHVEVGVAVQHEESVEQGWQRVVQRPCGSSERRFESVAERDAVRRAVAEVRPNLLVGVVNE